MRHRTLSLFWLICCSIAGGLVSTLPAMGLLMPCYGNTSSQFSAALSAADKIPVIAVINPSDGPTSSSIGSIRNFSSNMRGKGGQVVGYINTFYGGLSYSDVESQMDRYISQYSVNGFFLDEVADNNSGYYGGVNSRATSRGKYIVSNPGTFVPSSYASRARTIVTYEDPYSAGWSSHTQSGWTGGYSEDKFGAVIYSAASGQLASIIQRARTLRYGWIFVTDRGGSDPFGAAPSYLTTEVELIRQVNLPTPVPAEEFRVLASTRNPATGAVTLSFPAATGRSYAVEYSDSLTTWQRAVFASDGKEATLVATAVTMSMTVTAPGASSRRFFRIADVTP